MGLAPKATPSPDYTGLAEKTAAAQKAATDQTTTANRPSQTDIYGNTSTWTQNPDGSWAQKQSMSGPNQGIYDVGQQMRGQLTGEAANAARNPYTTEGLPDFTNYDMSQLQNVDVSHLGGGMFNMDPKGNAKEIQDATYGLLSQQRDLTRDSEIQRLKNQGLTEDSPAFQRAMLRQGQADTDAQLKSLLAGQTEYGNQYTRALAGNQSNFGQNADTQRMAAALRGQQFSEQGQQASLNAELRKQGLNEQQFMRQQPLNDLQKLIQTQQQGTAFGNIGQAGTPGTPDYTSAARTAYEDQVANMNAQTAYNAQLWGAGGQVAAGLLGSKTGQEWMNSAGNATKDWWTSLWSDSTGAAGAAKYDAILDRFKGTGMDYMTSNTSLGD